MMLPPRGSCRVATEGVPSERQRQLSIRPAPVEDPLHRARRGPPPPMGEDLETQTLNGISTYFTPASVGSSTRVGLAGSAKRNSAISPLIWPATSSR